MTGSTVSIDCCSFSPKSLFLFVLTMSQYLNECRYATKLRSPVKQSRTDPKLLDLL